MVGGVYFFTQRYSLTQAEGLRGRSLVELSASEISGITILRPLDENGELTFTRQGGDWLAVYDNQTIKIPTDSMLPFFKCFQGMEIVDVKTSVKQMGEYGLADGKPTLVVKVLPMRGVPIELLLGSVQYDGKTQQYTTFVRPAKERVVYQVGEDLVGLFKKNFNDFRNTGIVRVDADSVVALRYAKLQDSAIVLMRRDSIWSLPDGVQRFNYVAINRQLRVISQLSSSQFCDRSELSGNLLLVNKLCIQTMRLADSVVVDVYKRDRGWVLHSSQNPKGWFKADTILELLYNPGYFVNGRGVVGK